MFEQHFAHYLLENQRITKPQYDLLKRLQQTRVKLGLIAVAEKLLTKEQAEKLNSLQRQTDRRFGDLAVEQGYLSAGQVDKLLEMQGNPYLNLVQFLSENDFLSLDQIEDQLNAYQLEHNFSHEDLQVMKAGDLDSIIPLFVRTDQPLAVKYLSLALRNVIRFIDSQPLIGKISTVTSYSFGNLALQRATGEHDLWLGFASQGDELMEVAGPFGKEDFPEMNEDAFDAVCEFINCINGLFTTELSFKGFVLDMQPPLFKRDQSIKGVNDLFVVPITIKGRQVDLIAAIDTQIEIDWRE